MIVCTDCSLPMKTQKIGVAVLELADDQPHKLWMADLLQCRECRKCVLNISPTQQPVAYRHEAGFDEKLATYKPVYKIR